MSKENEGYGISDFKERVLDLAYPRGTTGEFLTMSPQQLAYAHYTISVDGENVEVRVDELINGDLKIIDMAQSLGLTPRVNWVTRYAAVLLSWGEFYGSFPDAPQSFSTHVSALYGWRSLGKEEKEAMQSYISSVEKLVSLENSFVAAAGLFTELDQREYQEIFDEVGEAMTSYAENDKVFDGFASTYPALTIGGSRESRHAVLRRDMDYYLYGMEWPARCILQAMEHWAKYRHSMEGSPKEKGMAVTIERLRDEYGSSSVDDLLHVASTHELDEDGYEIPHEELPQALSPYMPTITWEQLLSFTSLVREYNIEWAMAAMDWGTEQ